MRYGIDVAILRSFGDPRPVVEIAEAAEAAGWDALFVWDHLAFVRGVASIDPWTTLAGVATRTERLLLGTAVTPVPRRRLGVLAQQVATLDLLSEGRVVFGAGTGGRPHEYEQFGEDGDIFRRAAMLDEALPLLASLWAGEEVHHRGEHYTVDGVTLAPTPLQRPRVPVWLGAIKPKALRRAAAWDGLLLDVVDQETGTMHRGPEWVADKVAYVAGRRAAAGRDMSGYEVAVAGASAAAGDEDVVARYAAAGTTWWLETVHESRGSYADNLARVQAGPPAS